MNTSSVFVVLVGVCLVMMTPTSAEISDECLGCICQASTGCNKDQGCTEAGVCGPFLITWGFWADAGKPVIKGTPPNDPNAYKNCVTDMFCASETVRSYTKIFGKDCNNDGKINCEDYVRIHKFGPGACDSQAIFESPFFKEYAKCKEAVRLEEQ